MNVQLTGVTKSFDGMQVVKPLTLTVRSGQFTTLLGPSGCGKTTLLRMIAGLTSPDSGEIRFDDEVVFNSGTGRNKPVHKRSLGMVFQDFALWPHLTVYENVAYGLRATGRTRQLDEQVHEAIRAVRLQGLEKRHPGQLSGGQQQRVAFARAVAVKPGLILFDEPLSALDAVLRDEMRIELMSLVRQFGMTALYVTHDQTEAMSMSDRIVVMQQGEIMQCDTPETIYKKPANATVARFVGRSNWLSGGAGMFRPEHLHWRPEDGDRRWSAAVKAVSYVGDRYEVVVETAEHGSWLGYHQERWPVGKQVEVFISSQHIHFIETREEVTV